MAKSHKNWLSKSKQTFGNSSDGGQTGAASGGGRKSQGKKDGGKSGPTRYGSKSGGGRGPSKLSNAKASVTGEVKKGTSRK